MKKVSIIVPCYNSENYIGRFLDSIIEQTYEKLELILINDGSCDQTEKIIFNYEEKLKLKNIEFKYYKKENGGAASAINLGLKKFTGDYLIWPDSDDILHPQSISKRVAFLENNKNYDLVRSGAKIVAENNLEKKIGSFYNKYHKEEDIFLNLILEKVNACPGPFMLRRENILRNIPTLNIYESKGGQNWQIELPNTYKQKCGYISEELYTYVVRGESHSHKNEHDLKKMIQRWREHKRILDKTILNMNITKEEKIKYLKIIEYKYIEKELIAYYKLLDKEKIKEKYELLKSKGKVSIRIKIIYNLSKINLLKIILKLRVI